MKTNEDMIKALAGLLEIDSVSVQGTAGKPFGDGPDKALEYTLSLCESLGFRTKRCGDMLGYAEIGQGAEMVGILAHLDVVPAGNGWEFPPFALTRKNGNLYGRGVTDDKGPAIASVFAMKDVLDSKVNLKKRIRIIFGLTEENGDWDDIEFYKKTEELPGCGFTPDADFPCIYGEKGIVMLEISLPSGGKISRLEGGSAPNMVADYCRCVIGEEVYEMQGVSAHGSTPEDGENAISKLMAQLPDNAVSEFYNACIGFDLGGERLNCDLWDEISGKLTLNTGMVRLENKNAVFSIDIRYPVSFSHENVVGRISEAVQKYGASVITLAQMNPVYMDKNGPVISSLMEAYVQVTGDVQSVPAVIGGGTYARAMDNIVAFGPMLPGRELTEHQKNEHMPESDFFLIRDIYRVALEKLLIL